MTDYEVVFNAFLSKIQDYDYGVLGEEVAERDFINLLNSGIIYFLYPKIKLDKDDLLKKFTNDLSNSEIQILATLMKREWFKRIVNSTDVLVQKFGEADFEFKSQAAHLNALAKYEMEGLDKDIKKMMSNYSRSNNGEVFDYRVLSGK